MRPPAFAARPALALAASLALAGPGRFAAAQAPAPAARVSVGEAVQVSRAHPRRPHVEVVLAADPGDPDRLLAGSMIENGEIGKSAIAYASGDGGRTWRPTLEREAAEGTSYFDPACAFGPEGVAYFALQTTRAHSELNASDDGGRTWRAPVRLDGMTDRPFLAVDHGRARSRGWIYCTGDAAGPAVYRSRDGGRTFEAPTRPAVRGSGQGKALGQGAALSDGTLVLPGHVLTKATAQQYSLRILRSKTFGESFLGDQVLGDFVADHLHQGVIQVLAAAPGSGAFPDRLYLVWCDRGKAGLRVMLAISKDRGGTWSEPVALSDGPDVAAPGPGAVHHAYLPTVAVNRAGVVAVTWYDGVLRGRELQSRVRLRASADGGATWLPGATVTDVVARGDAEADDFWVGHTAGLAADATGAFHPLWVDNRTGVRQVYTATLLVE